ncbi:MAG TPA: YciI family protein [Thermoleophilaceae bacterium]
MYVLVYDYVDNIAERRAPHRPRHLDMYRKWKAEGRVVMGGAIGDPPYGAHIVFDVEDPAVVEEFAKSDPYVLEGLVTDWRIVPWAVVG